MKERSPLTHSLPAKIAAYFLLAVFGLALLLSLLAGGLLYYNFSAYSSTAEQTLINAFGSLSADEADRAYYSAFADDGQANLDELSRGTNLTFAVYDDYDQLIAKNTVDGREDYVLEFYCTDPAYEEVYGDSDVESYLYDEDSGMIFWNEEALPAATVEVHINKALPEADVYAQTATLVLTLYRLRYAVWGIAALALLLCVLLFVFLLCAAGCRAGQPLPVLNPLDRIPFDVYCVLYFFAFMMLYYPAYELLSYHSGNIPAYGCAALLLVASALWIVSWCQSVAARLKVQGWGFLRRTLCWRFCSLCWRIWLFCWHGLTGLLGGLGLVWQVVAGLAAVSLVEFFILVLFWADSVTVVLWLMQRMVLFVALPALALLMRRLLLGGRALAAGDLSYRVSTRHLHGALKEHAQNLNSISDGMSLAVEERLKSERLKTELITNVSHDIKTPLTSIINYTDLLSHEPIEDEKAREYIAILSKHSARLKKLIDDLVEASRASTGNIEVHLAPCQAEVLLTQAVGEYQSRTAEKELSVILQQAPQPVRIWADGRLIWRVLDNLMNNICKYAMPGTRVYIGLQVSGGQALLSFKNISQSPLNISADELMERFVRGDSSRSTPGHGLGLSIARSLTELQGGSMRLTVDGDLFKAVLSFPLIAPGEETKPGAGKTAKAAPAAAPAAPAAPAVSAAPALPAAPQPTAEERAGTEILEGEPNI